MIACEKPTTWRVMAAAFFAVALFCRGELRSDPIARFNPYSGMQQREEVFEFAEKPSVNKEGDKWLVTFASKGNCDATVAIVDKDGKVIRHLASGVLGKNAPWPFQQGTLSQRIEWDGRDDSGKVAPPGCKVKVSLGLRARFDKALGWNPNYHRTDVDGVAVGTDGQLYVLSGGPNVRVFDRQGNYLRTIMPPAANVPAEQMALIDWTTSGSDGRAMYRPRSGGSSTFDLYRYAGFAFPKQGPVATRDGRLALVTKALTWNIDKPGRKLIRLDTRSGAVAEGSIVDLDQGGKRFSPGALGNDGRPFTALSPDGKTLYLSGFMIRAVGGARSAIHAVFRVSMDRPGLAERLLGQPETAGSDNAHFDQARGIACDKEGNVYVCDWGNDRIQVFGPDASHVKSIAIEKPDQVAVHLSTGAIYVLCATPTERHFKIQVVKLGGLNDATVRATLDLPTNQFGVQALLALDSECDPPALWLAAAEGVYGVCRALWRFEDRGERFEKVVDVAEAGPSTAGWDKWRPKTPGCYLAADPLREEIYVRESDCCFPSPALRVDGRSGTVIQRLDLPVEQMHVGPDGLVYMRVANGGEWLVRYDPDNDEFVPMPGGELALQNRKWPIKYKEKELIGINVPANFGAQTWADQMAVAPNGDIYIPVGPLAEHIAELEKAGLPRPPKPAGSKFHNLLRVVSPDGKLKCPSALPGLGHYDGLRVGPSGAVYMGLQCQPVGQSVPDGIAPDGRWFCAEWGTLVKFGSTPGRFPIGAVVGRWDDKTPEEPSHVWGAQYRIGQGEMVRIENLLWDYGGASPITQGGCTCNRGLFDLDRFERVFLPALQTCTVNVLDANGNVIARLGGYGNEDSRGRQSPVVDPGTGLLRARRPGDPPGLLSPLAEPDPAFAFPKFVAVTDEALYVHDMENERIVRAILGYQAEETVPLP